MLFVSTHKRGEGRKGTEKWKPIMEKKSGLTSFAVEAVHKCFVSRLNVYEKYNI